MSVEITCPGCGAVLEVPDDAVDATEVCPECGAVVPLGGPPERKPEDEPSPAPEPVRPVPPASGPTPPSVGAPGPPPRRAVSKHAAAVGIAAAFLGLILFCDAGQVDAPARPGGASLSASVQASLGALLCFAGLVTVTLRRRWCLALGGTGLLAAAVWCAGLVLRDVASGAGTLRWGLWLVLAVLLVAVAARALGRYGRWKGPSAEAGEDAGSAAGV